LYERTSTQPKKTEDGNLTRIYYEFQVVVGRKQVLNFVSRERMVNLLYKMGKFIPGVSRRKRLHTMEECVSNAVVGVPMNPGTTVLEN